MGSSRTWSRWSLAAEACLGLLLLFGVLALASAPTWTLAPSALLATVALALAALGARRQGQRLHWPFFAWVLLVPVVLCALQLLPLPRGLLGALSPQAAELVDFVLVPLGLSESRPLSLDPPATWRGLSKSLTALLVFLAAVHLCRNEEARTRLGGGVAGLGALVSLVGFGHWVVGAEKLFGLYAFYFAAPPLLTPFGNPNHLAGFLGISSAVALGLARSTRSKGPVRSLWLAAWVLCSVGVFSSLSRGGILCWLLGQLVFVALVWRERRAAVAHAGKGMRGLGRGGSWESVAVLALLLSLFGAGLYASERLEDELATATNLEGLQASKLELLPDFARVAGAFPLTGAGRGAFEVAYPRQSPDARAETFTHPENALLQWATEFGLPAAVLLTLGFLVTLGVLLSRLKPSSLQLGAIAGLVGVALHNQLDFNLELGAVAHVALVLVAVAWTRGKGQQKRSRWALQPVPALGTALVLGVVALLALVPGTSTLESSEAVLREGLAANIPPANLRAVGISEIDRHPAHWPLYALIAEGMARQGGDPREALSFVNRALFLNPHDGASHRAAARSLLALGARGQAFSEYRLAALSGDRGALQEAERRARTLSERVSLTPDSDRALWVMRALQGRGLKAEAVAYVQAVQEHSLDEPPLALARLALAEARLHLEAKNIEAAARACDVASKLAPEEQETQLGRVDLLRAMGKKAEALVLLEELVGRFPGSTAVGFRLAIEHLLEGNPRAARATLKQTEPFVSNFGERAEWLEVEARIYESEGYLNRAVTSRRSACRLAPSAACAFGLARNWERLERYEEALTALREGLGLLPANQRGSSAAWVARLEARIAEEAALGEQRRSADEARLNEALGRDAR